MKYKVEKVMENSHAKQRLAQVKKINDHYDKMIKQIKIDGQLPAGNKNHTIKVLNKCRDAEITCVYKQQLTIPIVENLND